MMPCEKASTTVVKMEERAMSRRTGAASRSWKRQGNGFFHRASGEEPALLTSEFWPSETKSTELQK